MNVASVILCHMLLLLVSTTTSAEVTCDADQDPYAELEKATSGTRGYSQSDRAYECFRQIQPELTGIHKQGVFRFLTRVLALTQNAHSAIGHDLAAKVNYHRRLIEVRAELLQQATLTRELGEWPTMEDEAERTHFLRKNSAVLADLIYRLPNSVADERFEIFRNSLLTGDTYFIGPSGYSILLVGIANCGVGDSSRVRFVGSEPLCSDTDCLATLNDELARFRQSLAFRTPDGWLSPYKAKDLCELPNTCRGASATNACNDSWR